jgi:hypothetical protein
MSKVAAASGYTLLKKEKTKKQAGTTIRKGDPVPALTTETRIV